MRPSVFAALRLINSSAGDLLNRAGFSPLSTRPVRMPRINAREDHPAVELAGAVSDCSRHTIAYDHYSLGHVVSILRRQWPSLGLGRGAAPIPPVRSFTAIAAASVGRALLHRLNGRFL